MEPTPEQEAGQRLEAFVRVRWTRQQGGIRALAARVGSSTETVYSWFRGDTEPNMGHLRELATALGVSRAEVVAALDGTVVAGNDPATTESRLRALEAAVALLGHGGGEGRPVRSAPLGRAG